MRQLVFGEGHIKNPIRIMKRLYHLLNSGKYISVDIVFYPHDPNPAVLKNILTELVHEMIKTRNSAIINKLNVQFAGKEKFKQCIEIMEPILLDMSSKTFRNPYPAADTIIRFGSGIVLVYRKNPPSGWAIPGGFINYGESAEDAAIREAREETGLAVKNLKLFGVFSDPDRDPRFHTISIVFSGEGKGKMRAGDDGFQSENIRREESS